MEVIFSVALIFSSRRPKRLKRLPSLNPKLNPLPFSLIFNLSLTQPLTLPKSPVMGERIRSKAPVIIPKAKFPTELIISLPNLKALATIPSPSGATFSLRLYEVPNKRLTGSKAKSIIPVAIPKAKFTGAVIIFLAKLKASELLISSGRTLLTSSDLFIAISNTIFRGKRRVSINPVAIPRMKLPADLTTEPIALNASTTGEYQDFWEGCSTSSSFVAAEVSVSFIASIFSSFTNHFLSPVDGSTAIPFLKRRCLSFLISGALNGII